MLAQQAECFRRQHRAGVGAAWHSSAPMERIDRWPAAKKQAPIFDPECRRTDAIGHRSFAARFPFFSNLSTCRCISCCTIERIGRVLSCPRQSSAREFPQWVPLSADVPAGQTLSCGCTKSLRECSQALHRHATRPRPCSALPGTPKSRSTMTGDRASRN